MKAKMIRALVVMFSLGMLGSMAVVPKATYSQESGGGGGTGGCCGGGGDTTSQNQVTCGRGTHQEGKDCVPNRTQ